MGDLFSLKRVTISKAGRSCSCTSSPQRALIWSSAARGLVSQIDRMRVAGWAGLGCIYKCQQLWLRFVYAAWPHYRNRQSPGRGLGIGFQCTTIHRGLIEPPFDCFVLGWLLKILFFKLVPLAHACAITIIKSVCSGHYKCTRIAVASRSGSL